jgi:hypothetical protein
MLSTPCQNVSAMTISLYYRLEAKPRSLAALGDVYSVLRKFHNRKASKCSETGYNNFWEDMYIKCDRA